MNQESVLYAREDKTAVITLNRPDRLNAINQDLIKNLNQYLVTAGTDPGIATIILTGAGKAFCAGEDLKETSAGKTLAQWTKEIDTLQEFQRVVLNLGKPLIAAVPGYALGGGLEFALSCDIRIASEDARFGFPETGVGLTITSAGTKLISQLVGLGKAKELIFTGEFIDASEALRIGLANRVVSRDALMTEALEMARKIGQRSPLALRLSRTAVDQGLHSSFEQILELEAAHLMICVSGGNQESFVRDQIEKMKKK